MEVFLLIVFWCGLLYAWVLGVRYLLRKDLADWKVQKSERRAKREALRRAAEEAENIDAEFERYMKGEK